MPTIEQHKQELDRILNIEDYDDESDALEDAEALCEIATDFEKEIERLQETNQAMESVLQTIGEHFKITPGDVPTLLEAIELQSTENSRLRVGLRFYGNGRHMAFADNVALEWEDVSGEPPNWLQNTRSDDYEMIEDGTIAKMVLCGKDQDWSEHDAGEPPAIDGEPDQ